MVQSPWSVRGSVGVTVCVDPGLFVVPPIIRGFVASTLANSVKEIYLKSVRDIQIIQGGMGIGVSLWPLAKAVSKAGGLGVVSGVAIHVLVARVLQIGDPGGHIRRAAAAFPVPSIAREAISAYFVEGGKPREKPFKAVPIFTINPSQKLINLNVFANFAAVWLAKEGHDEPVGINYLEKVQLPHLSSFYGAMLAGVNCILMGAGIPSQVPGCLDSLALHQPSEYRLAVAGASSNDHFTARLDPATVLPSPQSELHRPDFFPIVSSSTLAKRLNTRSSGKVNGFIFEHHSAGGHNAPPRVHVGRNESNEPIYGPEDEFSDFSYLQQNDIPFWLAGGYASPQMLVRAREQGAAGVQVGSIFALCEESSLNSATKAKLRDMARQGVLEVRTDPIASSSDFPFKIASVKGTLSELKVLQDRKRICDIGALSELYRKDDGSVGLRCTADDPAIYARKGGTKETEGRVCLCNGLFADIDLPQVMRDGSLEPAVITLGKDTSFAKILPDTYTAADVMRYLQTFAA